MKLKVHPDDASLLHKHGTVCPWSTASLSFRLLQVFPTMSDSSDCESRGGAHSQLLSRCCRERVWEQFSTDQSFIAWIDLTCHIKSNKHIFPCFNVLNCILFLIGLFNSDFHFLHIVNWIKSLCCIGTEKSAVVCFLCLSNCI